MNVRSIFESSDYFHLLTNLLGLKHTDEHHFGDEADPHNHEDLEHAHGPKGEMTFHSADEEHHKGIMN